LHNTHGLAIESTKKQQTGGIKSPDSNVAFGTDASLNTGSANQQLPQVRDGRHTMSLPLGHAPDRLLETKSNRPMRQFELK